MYVKTQESTVSHATKHRRRLRTQLFAAPKWRMWTRVCCCFRGNIKRFRCLSIVPTV